MTKLESTRVPGAWRAKGKWRRTGRVILATVLILLGLLWTLQGADAIHIRPILCLADCQPVTGGSTAWLVIGIVTVAAGLTVLAAPWRRRRSPERES